MKAEDVDRICDQKNDRSKKGILHTFDYVDTKGMSITERLLTCYKLQEMSGLPLANSAKIFSIYTAYHVCSGNINSTSVDGGCVERDVSGAVKQYDLGFDESIFHFTWLESIPKWTKIWGVVWGVYIALILGLMLFVTWKCVIFLIFCLMIPLFYLDSADRKRGHNKKMADIINDRIQQVQKEKEDKLINRLAFELDMTPEDVQNKYGRDVVKLKNVLKDIGEGK